MSQEAMEQFEKIFAEKTFSRIVFFTGAGMSAESGVPTYRGKGGVWTEYNYEEYACQEAFERDPEKVWTFQNMRLEAVSDCEPHEGHRIITRMQERFPEVSVVTQNIDGMHQRAGSENVYELHGSLWKVRCDRAIACVCLIKSALTSLEN